MITHLLKKDIKHARGPLIIWLLLILLQCGLVGSGINPGDRVMQTLYQTLSVLLPLFQMLLLIVVVPLLVHAEPLVGTTAFWFTRPVSGTALLKSKIVFVVLVLVTLPLLAQIIVFAANGATPGDIALAVPEIVMTQLVWILTIGVLAVITPNFGRFAIVGVGFLVACILTMMVMQFTRILLNPEMLVEPAQNYSLGKSSTVAAWVLAILAGSAIVIHQYLTRRTVRSIIAAALASAAFLVVQIWWPWDFLKEPVSKDSGAALDAASLKIVLASPPNVNDVMTTRGRGVPDKNIQSRIDTQGAPGGYVIEPENIRPSLKTADGQTVPVQSFSNSFYVQPDTDAMEAALGGAPILGVGARGYVPPVSLGLVSAALFDKYKDQPLVYSADIDFVASKYLLRAEMPLVKGSRYDSGSEHVVITDVLKLSNGAEIVLRIRRMQLLFDPKYEHLPSEGTGQESNIVWLLRNKKRNEVIMQDQYNNFQVVSNMSILTNQPLELYFGRNQNQAGFIPDLTPEWLADAELVRLELVPVSKYSKRLTVEKFLMNGQGSFTSEANKARFPDVDALNKIALPENPTRDQVKAYIDAIMVASRKQNGFSDKDPQVAMLDKIGSENIDLLFEEGIRVGFGGEGSYITSSIQHLARPEDKDSVLQILATRRDLANLVVKFGWQADAHDTLVSVLRDVVRHGSPPFYLPVSWLKAVVLLQDPATFPDLKTYLADASDKRDAVDELRQLPGFDLQGAIDDMWQKDKDRPTYSILDAATIAAHYGHKDALETMVGIMRTEKNQYMVKQIDSLFKQITPATGDNGELLLWYDANKDKLVYDPQTKTFTPPK